MGYIPVRSMYSETDAVLYQCERVLIAAVIRIYGNLSKLEALWICNKLVTITALYFFAIACHKVYLLITADRNINIKEK